MSGITGNLTQTCCPVLLKRLIENGEEGTLRGLCVQALQKISVSVMDSAPAGLKRLKTTISTEVQSNFQEICQAGFEKILYRLFVDRKKEPKERGEIQRKLEKKYERSTLSHKNLLLYHVMTQQEAQEALCESHFGHQLPIIRELAKKVFESGSLHFAIASQNLSRAKELLSKQETALESKGWHVLHLAALFGEEKIVELIVEGKKADVGLRHGKLGVTPLHYAALKGHVRLMKWLVRKGANVNLKTHTVGATPLHYAAREGRVDAVKYLIKQKAFLDDHLLEPAGLSPLFLAVMKGHLRTAEELISSGAKIEKGESFNDKTLEHYAAKAPAMTELLKN